MSKRYSRRQLLRGAGGAVMALPFLEAFAPAHAGAVTRPKRFLVVVHRQGSVLNRWLPTGNEYSWSLSELLSPLSAMQDRVSVIAGLDNAIPSYNTAGNGHENAEMTLLTGMPFADQSATTLTAGGPSIEQVIAERISADRPYSRFDVAVGGSSSGYQTAGHFWYGPDDPVTSFSSPLLAYSRLFSDADLSPAEAAAQQARRGSVLDAVLENFNSMMGDLGAEDRARLEAHAEKVRELEQRVTSAGSAACVAPVLAFPSDYDLAVDDDLSFPAQAELITLALACDQTRVGTLVFTNGESPTFPWLDVSGQPLVNTAQYDNWHTMVHDGREEEGLFVGLQWYVQCFADLLQLMSETTDSDGDNLLDTTCVLFTTEFGNGTGHNTVKIPVVLAGALGGADQGRFLDYMSGGPDDDYTFSDYTTNQLMVSLLQLFGGSDSTFGHKDAALPAGPLPGLL